MRSVPNYFYIYTGLWVLYFLQGTLYASGSSISQAILAVVLLLSGFTMIKVNYFHIPRYGFPKYIVALNFIFFLITIYGVIRWMENDNTGTQWHIFLKEFYCSLLPIYAFFFFAKRGFIQQRELNVISLTFIIVTILFYFKQLYEVSERYNSESVTNNAGYMFVPLLALLPLINISNKFKYILLIIFAAFILISAKRGAIMIFIVCALEYLYFQVKDSSKKYKIWTISIVSCFIVAGYHYSMSIISEDPLLSRRLDDTLEGNSSSRDYIYGKLITNIENQDSPIKLLIGYGANGTTIVVGKLAHNDWLEFFIDMGLIGFAVYLFYWICFWKTRKYLINKDVKHSFFIIMTFCFLRSFLSMSINDMYIVTTFVIGYCIAQADRERIMRCKHCELYKRIDI